MKQKFLNAYSPFRCHLHILIMAHGSIITKKRNSVKLIQTVSRRILSMSKNFLEVSLSIEASDGATI